MPDVDENEGNRDKTRGTKPVRKRSYYHYQTASVEQDGDVSINDVVSNGPKKRQSLTSEESINTLNSLSLKGKDDEDEKGDENSNVQRDNGNGTRNENENCGDGEKDNDTDNENCMGNEKYVDSENYNDIGNDNENGNKLEEVTKAERATSSGSTSTIRTRKVLQTSALTSASVVHVTPKSVVSPGLFGSPVNRELRSLGWVDTSPRGQAPDGVIDIDILDSGDVLSQHWVAPNVMEMWQRLELQVDIRAEYLTEQTEISGAMRAILVDWLVQVHQKFRLQEEVVHLSVSLIDRYLSAAIPKCTIHRNKLQLVGVAAMFIASKYEEIFAPELHDFVDIADSAYTRTEIQTMERTLLNTLGFRIGVPSALRYMQRNIKAYGACQGKRVPLVKALSHFVAELALVEEHMLVFKNSVRGGAAVLLAGYILCGDEMKWDRTMEHYSGYTEDELKKCMMGMMKLLERGQRKKKQTAKSGELTAIIDKYAASKYGEISRLIETLDLSGVRRRMGKKD